MPTTKTKPTQINTDEPKPEQAPAQAAEKLKLGELTKQCLEFGIDATEQEQRLLSDILEHWKQGNCSFAVVAATGALHALKAHVSVDDLENDNFCELLNLFAQSLTGWGYGGLPEKIIERLLRECNRETKIDRILQILEQEFTEIHAGLSLARQALKEHPEELAEAIQQAAEKLRKGNDLAKGAA